MTKETTTQEQLETAYGYTGITKSIQGTLEVSYNYLNGKIFQTIDLIEVAYYQRDAFVPRQMGAAVEIR